MRTLFLRDTPHLHRLGLRTLLAAGRPAILRLSIRLRPPPLTVLRRQRGDVDVLHAVAEHRRRGRRLPSVPVEVDAEASGAFVETLRGLRKASGMRAGPRVLGHAPAVLFLLFVVALRRAQPR